MFHKHELSKAQSYIPKGVHSFRYFRVTLLEQNVWFDTAPFYHRICEYAWTSNGKFGWRKYLNECTHFGYVSLWREPSEIMSISEILTQKQNTSCTKRKYTLNLLIYMYFLPPRAQEENNFKVLPFFRFIVQKCITYKLGLRKTSCKGFLSQFFKKERIITPGD